MSTRTGTDLEFNESSSSWWWWWWWWWWWFLKMFNL